VDRRKLLKLAGAASVFAAAGATYSQAKRTRFSGGRYIQMGTSVTAGTGTKYGGIAPSIVGDRLDMLAENAAVPGSCAGVHKFPDMTPLSLCSLADAIISDDWTRQSARTGNQIRDAAISRLMMADFAGVTHIGLEYGTNDFRYDRPIGADSDVCGETFKGALNYSIERLRSSFPKAQPFLITPAWIPTLDGDDSDHCPNAAGAFLKDYIEAMQRIAELRHVPCLDMCRALGVNRLNYEAFTYDGTRPTDETAARRGEIIAAFMDAAF
jgi:hypothetical protein